MWQAVFNISASLCILLTYYRIGGIIKHLNTIERNAPWLLRSR